MSDVSDRFHLFLCVTPVMDFTEGAAGLSVKTDLVFEAVPLSDVFSVDKTSLVNSLSSLLFPTDG